MGGWWQTLLGVAAGLLVLWLVLLLVLWWSRPDGTRLRDALLLRRLAADRSLPGGVRLRLAALLVYLAVPIDLVPDMIPVLGQVDDAIVVVLALRSVARRAGPEVLARHWPGTPDGLAALHRLAGLDPPG